MPSGAIGTDTFESVEEPRYRVVHHLLHNLLVSMSERATPLTKGRVALSRHLCSELGTRLIVEGVNPQLSEVLVLCA